MPEGRKKSILEAGQEQVAWSIWRASVVGVCIVLPLMYATPGNDDLITTIFYTPIILALIGIRWLLKHDRVQIAGIVLTTAMFGISAGAVFILGGVHVAVTGSFFVCVMVAAATLGPRAAVGWTIAACVTLVAFGAVEQLGYLPTPLADAKSVINALASSVFPLLLSVYLLRVMLRIRDDAIDAAEARERERDQAEAEMLQAQKMDVVGRLASGIAHDFNNLLTVIQSTVDVIRIAGPDEELLDDVDSATQRANLLTRRLLTFARPRNPSTSKLDLGEAVDDILPLLETMAGDEIRLTCSVEPNCVIEIDELAFQQIVLNLIINAREAQDARGTIDLFVKAREESVELVVRDSGPGVPAELEQQIFEPFFTTKSSGTGLGLSTIRRLIAESNGEISVGNASPGAEFRATWPHATGAPERSRKASGVSAELSYAPHILLVDDNEGVRRSMAALLEAQRWTVVEAGDGLEALAYLERNTADLIITDSAMPGMTGPELAQTFRDSGGEVPILLVSGTPLETDLPNDCTFLPKPFGSDRLLESVRGILQESPN